MIYLFRTHAFSPLIFLQYVEHPRTKFGYEPQTDFIAPRVQKKGSTSLELTESIWIEDR